MRTDTLQGLDPVDLHQVRHMAENPAFEDLFEAIVSGALIDPTFGRDEHFEVAKVELDRRPKDVWKIRGYLIAAAVVALLLGVTLGSGPATVGTQGQRHFGAWEPARHVDTKTYAVAPGGRGKWQLVADVSGVGWQQDSSGPPPGELTCAAIDACYAIAGHYSSPQAGAPFLGESFYSSSDLGETWTALPMPSGLLPSTGLSCPSALSCAVAGTIGNEDVFAETIDGGHQWTVHPLASTDRILFLACTSPDSCSAVATTHNDVAAGLVATSPNPDRTEWLLDTSDGGATWAQHPFQVGQQVLGLSCPGAGTCFVMGIEPSAGQPSEGGSSFTQKTTDGGADWTTGALPSGTLILNPLGSGLACADARDCMALVEQSVPNVDQCQGTPPHVQPPAGQNSCSTSPTTEVSAVVATQDGGRTWQFRTLPSDVPLPQLGSISCPTAQTCWISGSDAMPMQIGKVSDGGSPLLLGTTDGGSSWHVGTFDIPANAPNYLGQAYISIGSISCPTTSSCVAFGAGAQSAPSVPLYRYDG